MADDIQFQSPPPRLHTRYKMGDLTAARFDAMKANLDYESSSAILNGDTTGKLGICNPYGVEGVVTPKPIDVSPSLDSLALRDELALQHGLAGKGVPLSTGLERTTAGSVPPLPPEASAAASPSGGFSGSLGRFGGNLIKSGGEMLGSATEFLLGKTPANMVRQFGNGAGDAFTELSQGNLLNAGKSLADGGMNALGTGFNGIKNEAVSIGNGTINAAKSVVNGDLGGAAKSFASGIAGQANSSAQPAASGTSAPAGQAPAAASNGATQAATNIATQAATTGATKAATGAATSAATGAATSGLLGSAVGMVGNIAGAAFSPVSMIGNMAGNFVGNAIGGKAGATVGGAISGATTGAAIGSVIPGVGTAIGGVVGGFVGGVKGLFGKKKK